MSEHLLVCSVAPRGELNALPAVPEAVAAFLASEVTGRENLLRPSAGASRLFRYAHELAGHLPPTDDERVKATVRGIRRTLGSRTAPRKAAPRPSASSPWPSARRRPQGAPRPRVALARLRWRVPAFRACRPQRRGHRGNRERSAQSRSVQQDRPGRHRTDNRHRARLCGVPGGGREGLARGSRHHKRAGCSAAIRKGGKALGERPVGASGRRSGEGAGAGASGLEPA